MWIIDYTGTARTEYDGGGKIVVRRDPVLGDRDRWQVIVQGDQTRFPMVFPTRDAALRQVELWLGFREAVMPKSSEDAINTIREDLIDAIMSIEDYQKEAAVTSGKLRHALIVLERLAVDFGRFVNSLPMEARS